MENTQVMKVSVALSSREIKIVEKLEKKLGLNFSSALRIIVREWEENRPTNGKAHVVGQASIQPLAVSSEPSKMLEQASVGGSTSTEVK